MKWIPSVLVWTAIFSTALLGGASLAEAGYVEIGASGTYRRSNFNPNSYDDSFALSGSVSYLFSEMSALEFSYTDGFSKQFVSSNGLGTDQTTTVHTQLIDLDFVLTLGEKDAVLRPYIKAGMGYLLKKRLVETTQGFHPVVIDNEPQGFIPSAGAGFRIAITENLSFKVGIDTWNSDPLGHGDTGTFDVAARAGLSWLF
jgi:hypothetical protein